MIKKDYPYMYARVSAKRKKLLDSSDYENLLKMQPNEIARRLEEGDYEQEINELGSDHEGIELVELALMRNVSSTMSHLVKIAPESLKPVIKSYLRRYDILSLKRLLRWKKGGEEDGIHSFLLPVGSFSFEDFEELAQKSFEEIVESIEFPESEIDYRSRIENMDDLRQIERELDRAYYEDISHTCRKVDSIWFDRFMQQEMEYENLKIALRLKKYGTEADEIRQWLVTEEVNDTLEAVLNAENVEEAIDIVENEGKIETVENGRNLEEIEHSLEVARLNRAQRNLHLDPLGATSILGYIIAKLIEVKNLRMLIRAKETGIQNLETIRRNLVMA